MPQGGKQMKQIILMSIRPEWYGLIEELKKTYEVRKDPLPEGAVVHIYLTKRWHKVLEKLFPKLKGKLGKVVAKFIVGKVERIDTHPLDNREQFPMSIVMSKWEKFNDILKKACLLADQLDEYSGYHKFKEKPVYALSITQLEIFDKPRELGEYKKKDISEAMTHWEYERATGCKAPCPAGVYRITHAPQSYQYAWIDD